MNNKYVLYHHGVIGMKWGVRRYQPYPSGSKGKPISKSKKVFNAIKKKKEDLAAFRQERHERKKQEVLRKGSADAILKFKGELSTSEMDNAIQRIMREKRLESLKENKPNSIKQAADGIKKTLDSISNKRDALKARRDENERRKEEAAARKKEEKQQKALQKEEKKKQKILESGSAEDVLKLKGKITNAEMENAIQRISKERRLEELQAGQLSDSERRIDSIMQKADRLKNYTNTAYQLYTAINNVSNAYSEVKNRETKKYLDKVANSGDASLVYQHRHQLSNEQFNAANKRINAEINIANKLQVENNKHSVHNPQGKHEQRTSYSEEGSKARAKMKELMAKRNADAYNRQFPNGKHDAARTVDDLLKKVKKG